MTDLQIVDLYWNRNADAISCSAQKYGNYCHSVAKNILSNVQDAEECVNDTWVGAWNAMPDHRPCNLRAFLGSITRRLACSRLRRDYAQKRGSGQLPLILEELDACLPTSPSAAQIVEAKELERIINAFLHTLPEQDCNIFLRRYWFAESIDQISRRYDLLPATVKSCLYRSRRKLRAYLEKEDLL
ncbi:MAG: sigma-70 family RNA polymerase sigma factor [Oscillospiraceae bacterium]|nr:sigma-70 family RNA polymerase sigma factor [Oscillospiraceae bacterium]